jgi:hypothetical protein
MVIAFAFPCTMPGNRGRAGLANLIVIIAQIFAHDPFAPAFVREERFEKSNKAWDYF